MCIRDSTHTSHGTDIAAIASGAGIQTTMTVNNSETLEGLTTALTSGLLPMVAVIKVAAGKPNLILPSRDGVYIKNQFRQAVLGATEAMHSS